MVIRRSHFISVCLLALASSIALTEYVMYSPPIIRDFEDDDLLDSIQSDNKALDQDFDASSEDVLKDQKDERDFEATESDAVIERSKPENQIPFSSSNEHKATIDKGDTIVSLLEGLGFDRGEVHLAAKTLSKVYNLRNIKVGQEILIRGEKNPGGNLVLKYLEITPDASFKIVAQRKDDGSFFAERKNIPLKKVIRNVSGTILPKRPSYSLKQCGVKPKVASEALKALSQVTNFKTTKSPISFEFVYSDCYDDKGNPVFGKTELLYAAAVVNGSIKRVYNFKDGGSSEYIDSSGTILKTLAKSKSMLAQPMDRTKITSGFGMRIHPRNGKLRRHYGVDFSAHVGTVVRSAANGVVQKAAYYSGYGRYVNIKHSPSINTAYGHLSRITVRNGQRVRQGQVIGYSGASGYVSGPHLHYEVIENGRRINPLAFIKQEPQKLSGQKLVKFNRFKKEINLQLVSLNQYASPKKKTAIVQKKYF